LSKAKCINILGKTYKIEYKDLSQQQCFGITDNRKGLIVVDKTLTGKELEQTLLHEFFHGVLYRTGSSQALSSEIEEIIVDSIATFLVDYFDFDLE